MKRLALLIPLLCSAAAAQLNCTLHSIAGTYSVSYLGWLTMQQPGGTSVTLPGTILGVVSIGYDGKLSGVTAVAGLGPVVDYEVIGTTELKSDCTGTLRLQVRPKGSTRAYETEIDRFVIDPDAKTLLAIMSDLGPGVYPVVLGTWKRLSPVPNSANW